MFHYDYVTENTCSQLISFDLDGDVVRNVRFMGGCDGNLKVIPILVDGMTVEQITGKLSGVHCGGKMTSCADQLARAVKEAYAAAQQENL